MGPHISRHELATRETSATACLRPRHCALWRTPTYPSGSSIHVQASSGIDSLRRRAHAPRLLYAVRVLMIAFSRVVQSAVVVAPAYEAARCLPSGDGYVGARLSGSIEAEIDWRNEGTECAGATRPDGGLRLRFSRFDSQAEGRIVLVLGVAGLEEGQSAKALPVNVTVIREGAGEFYSTQGDDK